MKHKHEWRKLTHAELAKGNWYCLPNPDAPSFENDCVSLAVWCCVNKKPRGGCLAGRCAKHAPKPPAPPRARSTRRWTSSVCGIRFDGDLVRDRVVAKLLNAANVVPGRRGGAK